MLAKRYRLKLATWTVVRRTRRALAAPPLSRGPADSVPTSGIDRASRDDQQSAGQLPLVGLAEVMQAPK